MGCVDGDVECEDDERPTHEVTIEHGFWIGRTEVTVGAFRRFIVRTGQGALPSPGFPQDENHPVVGVTWNDAHDYCKWVGGRLPIEEEWEYVARWGTQGWKYVWGSSEVPGAANGRGLSGGDRWEKTAPVGSFQPTSLGLFDLAGNASEWCENWYRPDAYHCAGDSSTGSYKVLRGGSWRSTAHELRISFRSRYWPDQAINEFGFRCVVPTSERFVRTAAGRQGHE